MDSIIFEVKFIWGNAITEEPISTSGALPSEKGKRVVLGQYFVLFFFYNTFHDLG